MDGDRVGSLPCCRLFIGLPHPKRDARISRV
jgi:hypothetical protein